MNREKLWCCLLVVALVSLASGCGSKSTIANSNNNNDQGQSVIVTVTDYSGLRVPNATVVLGYSSGAMKTYGETDANGQIAFEKAPENATVTAAKTCLRSGETTTTYSIDIEYDVNGSVVLSLDNCASSAGIVPPVNDTPLGTLTVNVNNIPGDVTRNEVIVGRQWFVGSGSLITRQSVTLHESDLNGDGTFSVDVTCWDTYLNTVAYGALRGLTFVDGMTVDIQMQPLSFVQFQVANLPHTAVSLQPSVSISGSGTGAGSKLGYTSYSLVSAPSATTLKAYYVPEVGDRVNYYIGVSIDRDQDGYTDSYQSLGMTVWAATPADQSFDLSQALPVPLVTVTGAGTATPTLSWSGVDPASTYVGIGASLRSSIASFYLSPSNLMRSRTSIRYPELPASLAAFRPSKVDFFSVSTSVYEGDVSKSSSGTYQAP